MRIRGIHHRFVAIVVVVVLPILLDAFAPIASQRATRNIYNRRFLSLDDEWGELTKVLSVTSNSVDQNEITKSIANHLHWENNNMFSKQWYATITETANDLLNLYQQLPTWIETSIVLAPVLAGAFTALYTLSFPPIGYRNGFEPYERGDYDPLRARAYYANHRFLVLQRCLQLFRLSYAFLVNLLVDKYIFRDEEWQRPKRARELLELITKLGPTAIKVGQALSVRPDLINEEYAAKLSTLQDRVPPFEGEAAREILQRELGYNKFSRIEGLSLDREPVASASIGQVYKAKINDRDVAIKVQRPGGLAEIALDLYIVREFAPIYQKFTGGATDLQALANEWGRGFIAELDYRREAASTIRFTEEMQKRGLTAVCAPTVLSQYSTEQVLVTEWVDGTRLDESDADDVPRLCSVALNAYLLMLLELQSLHCDPHPGNLLRTPDGRLCILDFGMTLDVDPNLQYSLLEFIAHLTSEEYDLLPEDLVRLGFLKEEKLEFARRSGVLEPLKYFLGQANKGGGAKAVRNRIFDEYREKYPGLSDEELRTEMRSEMKQQMQQIVERESVATGITVEIEELQRQNRDSFKIPEWFLYCSRAFLTLEGVSLQADESYSLVKSCFPYIAKRLVADDDPRVRKALRDLIYGAGDTVDVNRLSDLADGFSSYTSTSKSMNQATKGKLILPESVQKDRRKRVFETESAITLAKDSADILLSKDGNLVQNLLVEESALAYSALFKDAARRTLVEGPKHFRDGLPFGFGSLLPPLPFEHVAEPFLRKNSDEIKAQELSAKLTGIVTQRMGSQRSESKEAVDVQVVVDRLRELDPEQAALVLKELRENLPRYTPLLGSLGRKFLTALLRTASHNVETTLAELERTGDRPDGLTRITAKGLSSAIERSTNMMRSSAD